MFKVGVVLLHNAYASSIVGLTDALEIANSHGLRSPALVSKERELVWSFVQSPVSKSARLRGGARLRPDSSIDSVKDLDLLYLPAAHYPGEEDFDAWLNAHRPLLPTLLEAHRRGTVIAANCTATFLLAESGLLDGRAATTTWWLEQRFRRKYPLVKLDVTEAVTEDSGLYCAGAMTAYHQLSLRLIESVFTKELAVMTAKTMHINQSQSAQQSFQYLNVAPVSEDTFVAGIQYWLRSHIQKRVDFSRLAEDLRITQKTLISRFKRETGVTPLVFLQNERLEVAKVLLVQTSMTIAIIMERVGYQDISAFTRLFKRKVGLTPSAYRDQFRKTLNLD